ncbi:hypothetical protein CH365_07035 [Leptospira neocaledonica]|uniref:Uncharacterized protein n=1 Tax=Leptospira neocaledonica TaxID=2023192 RepID=A0A2M9ZZ32_9LEPT|nr:hypothetical protein CH365_07035 [Leptospira neocaledonica]
MRTKKKWAILPRCGSRAATCSRIRAHPGFARTKALRIAIALLPRVLKLLSEDEIGFDFSFTK